MHTRISAPLSAHRCTLAHGDLAWLEAGPAGGTGHAGGADGAEPAALVLLHGIGSCAVSWQGLMPRLAAQCRVLAWDAPGYGGSVPLSGDHPLAADYAAAAEAWLQAAGVLNCVLLGHSLGGLIAAALAQRLGSRVQALLLASPAQGYADAPVEVRRTKFEDRVQALATLGAAGMAAQRAARLCAPGASAEVVAQVRENMARVQPRGYGQAAWMLSHDSIHAHLQELRTQGLQTPTAVICGAADAITPPTGARALATRHGLPYTELPGLGHACYLEDPAAFEAALLATQAGLGLGLHEATAEAGLVEVMTNTHRPKVSHG